MEWRMISACLPCGFAPVHVMLGLLLDFVIGSSVTWHSDPPPLLSLPLKTNPDHSRTPRTYPRILNSSRNLLSPPALLRITLLWPPSLNHRNYHQTLLESINASVKRHQSYHQSLRTLFGRYTIFHLSLINLSDIVWPHSFYHPFVFHSIDICPPPV